MSWVDKVVEAARKRIAEEPELLKKAYDKDFADYAQRTGLFFSFGDITHLINVGLNYSISIRRNGGGAGIAGFEELIMRFRLYLIQDLKALLSDERPYKGFHGKVDHNFVTDFLDLFKILDRVEAELKEIREKEGGFYG